MTLLRRCLNFWKLSQAYPAYNHNKWAYLFIGNHNLTTFTTPQDEPSKTHSSGFPSLIDLGGEDSGFEFLAVPIMVIISTAFLTINKLANLYGEPFSENKTSVTIDEICKTIEQNCNEIKAKLE